MLPADQQSAITELSDKYCWPDDKPDSPISSWAWGIAGKELLRSFIPADADVILEIGTLLGGSARFFAEHCPQAHLICVDPWTDVAEATDRPFLQHVPELADFVVGRPNGLFHVFLASNWELRNRLVPLRGFSPDILAEVFHHGIEPNAIYVDGSHAYEDVLCDLAAARSMFPEAILCGDDWTWPGVEAAVTYFAQHRGDILHTQKNTWLLESSGKTVRFATPSARDIQRGRKSDG